MNKPMISVVMISYNHQEYIKKALMSVMEQQSDKFDLEILIVDDGSNDNTQKIIMQVQEKYPNLVFPTFKEHIGITAINKNLNEQIKKANGEYIAFLAGDDLYYSTDTFKKSLKLLEGDKSLGVVISEGRHFDIKQKKMLGTCQEKKIIEMINKNEMKKTYHYIVTNIPSLYIQGYLIKKSIIKAIDYFDEKIIADDWAFNIKLFKYLSTYNKKAIYCSPEVFQHNIHPKNTTYNTKEQCPRILGVIKKYSPQKNKNQFLAEKLVLCSILSLQQKEYKYFLKYLVQSIYLFPYSLKFIVKRIFYKFKRI